MQAKTEVLLRVEPTGCKDFSFVVIEKAFSVGRNVECCLLFSSSAMVLFISSSISIVASIIRRMNNNTSTKTALVQNTVQSNKYEALRHTTNASSLPAAKRPGSCIPGLELLCPSQQFRARNFASASRFAVFRSTIFREGHHRPPCPSAAPACMRDEVDANVDRYLYLHPVVRDRLVACGAYSPQTCV